jgi:hypothetical protein
MLACGVVLLHAVLLLWYVYPGAPTGEAQHCTTGPEAKDHKAEWQDMAKQRPVILRVPVHPLLWYTWLRHGSNSKEDEGTSCGTSSAVHTTALVSRSRHPLLGNTTASGPEA